MTLYSALLKEILGKYHSRMCIERAIKWMLIACRTHEYWSQREHDGESNSIHEISIQFDDSWSNDARDEFMKLVSANFIKVVNNKIILQHDRDTAWNELVACWNKQGVTNVINHVTLVLEADRSYFVDDQGRKSSTFCDLDNGMDWFPETDNRIPWFNWIP